MASTSKDTSLIHGLSTEEIQLICKESIQIKSKAYCKLDSLSFVFRPFNWNAKGPYSKFRVGCALLLSDPSISGSIITGVNVENASYPVGVCAERCALGTAIAAGHGYGSFKAIGVSTDLEDFCSPCGMCRQFIREFCANDTPIFMFNNRGKWEVKTVGEVRILKHCDTYIDEDI